MTTPRQTVTSTHRSIIRAHLMTGATISTWEAYERYQITCLAQRIYDLRKAGMAIHSKSTLKNGKRFNLYWFDKGMSARNVSGKADTPADARGTGGDDANKSASIVGATTND